MLDNVNNILKNYQKTHSLPEKTADIHNEPVLTSKLKPMIEERGVTDKIHLYETDYESDTILAMIQMEVGMTGMYAGNQDIAHIYFQRRLNTCWRRFVVCKEMYHCMLDRTMDERVGSVEDLGRLVELLSHDTTAVSGKFLPFQTEQQAELLALETLIPVEYRLQMQADFTAGNISTQEIAEMFRIPEVYIAFLMQPTYMAKIVAYRKPLLF